jgi:hypothetical protein
MQGRRMTDAEMAMDNARRGSAQASDGGGGLNALTAIVLVGLGGSLVVALVTQDWSPPASFTGLE